MNWQARTYERLRDRGWYRVGTLFEAIEPEIPLHFAMRAVMQSGRHSDAEMPTITAARWRKFRDYLSAIGVETKDKPANRFKWQDWVRLRYVEERVCGDCGGPVIKASWAVSHHKKFEKTFEVACLACEAASVPKLEIQEGKEAFVIQLPAPASQPTPLSRPAADQIGDAVQYVVLHRLIQQWGPPIPIRKPVPWSRAPPVSGYYFAGRKPSRSKPNERAPDRSKTG